LFEWVIENLSKNSVDAMGNTGTIAIKILRGNEGKIFIDISDTGKGIPVPKSITFSDLDLPLRKGVGAWPYPGKKNY
jgi:K+-sensing histidine kinase KdpD